MKYLLILIIALLPVSAEAAYHRSGIAKPPRGSYMSSTKTPTKKGYQQLTVAKAVKMKTFRHLDTGIVLKHPDNWEAVGGGKTVSLRPVRDDTRASMRDSSMMFTVSAAPNNKDHSLKEIERWFMNQATLLPSSQNGDWYIPSFTLISSEDATLLGKPAKKFIYTGEVGSVKMKVVLYIASFNKKFYSAQLRTEPADFEKDLPAFEQVLSSLSIKETAKAKPVVRRSRRR